MRRELRLPALIMMGLGSTVGAGVFVITGTVAANHTGPAVAISYLLACVLCLSPAACYAEFSAMQPESAGAYGFSMASMGRGVAWLTGWLLLLEYLMAVATLAVGWSAYVNGFLEPLGLSLSSNWSESVFEWLPGEDLHRTGAILNLPAAAIVLLIAGILCIGTKESSRVTNIVVTIKIVTILAIIGVSTSRIDPDNWQPFLPSNTGAWGEFGVSGVLRGASIVFVAYLGFDVVAAVAREVSDPQRNVPRAILAVVLICTILYVLMALAITGIAPSSTLGVANPVALATERAGLTGNAFRTLLASGTLVGLTSGMLAILFAQTRVFYAMSRDGLLPASLSRLSKRFDTPVVATAVAGIGAAALAGTLPVTVLSELIAIGTLSIFVLICLGIIVMRRRAPTLPRLFRVPWSPLVPLVGAAGCLLLMASLPAETWLRFGAWVLVGATMYGARHISLSRKSARSLGKV